MRAEHLHSFTLKNNNMETCIKIIELSSVLGNLNKYLITNRIGPTRPNHTVPATQQNRNENSCHLFIDRHN